MGLLLMRNYFFKKNIFLFITLIALSGCVSNGGYKNPWKINERSANANQAPSTLSSPSEWQNSGQGALGENAQTQNNQGAMILGNNGQPVNGQDADGQGLYDSPYRGVIDYNQKDSFGASAGLNTMRQGNLYGMPPSPAAAVRVALLAPLSGKAAHIGESFLNASQMALFDLKMNGFEIAPYDTQSTPEGARQAALKAVSEGATLILGPLFADSVRAVRSVAARSKVSVIGFSTDWTTASSNSYVMGFMPFTQVQRIVQHAAKKGYRKIGVIAPDDLYGQAVINTYLEEAARYGIQTVDIVRFKPGIDDISLRIREFSKYDQRRDEEGELFEEYELPFDAVLMAVGSEQAIAVSNLLTFHDLDPRSVKRLGTGLWDDTALIGEDNLNGAWFAAPSPDLRQSFIARYKILFGKHPPRLASLAYDATALSIVLAKHGLNQGQAPSYSREFLTNPNGFSGIDGIFRFHANGLIERGLAVLELNRGKINVIESAPPTFMRPNL
jgi:branched-chain amino acid transport system substrate-binding protein